MLQAIVLQHPSNLSHAAGRYSRPADNGENTMANKILTKNDLETVSGIFIDAADLVIVDVFPPENYDANAFAGETWANQVLSGMNDLLCCSDYEGTTTGDPDGINILILRDNLEIWEFAANEIGAELIVSDVPVSGGVYGDSGYTIKLFECDGEFIWVE